MRISVVAVLICTAVVANSAIAQDPVYFSDATLKAAVEDALWILDPTPTDMLGLTDLVCVNNGVTDIKGLEYAENLQHLNLRFNRISGISSLSGLRNLRHLDLSRNYEISSISALSGLVNLSYLNLHINSIGSISALSEMHDLSYLDLHGNQIVDVSALSKLDKLRHLDLNENGVEDVMALSGLRKLEKLYLHYNRIRDVSALADLTSVHTLNIYLNEISDISALAHLTRLQVLSLHYNQVSDISALSALTHLTQLRMQANPLNGAACEIYLPRILGNNPGIDLEYDECDSGYMLTVSSSAGGSVTEPGEGARTYTHVETVAVVATAFSGYRFLNWTGTAVNTGKIDNPNNAHTTVTVDGDYTLMANFGQAQLSCPAVSTYAVRRVEGTSAVLAASLVDDGGEACKGEFNYWVKGEPERSRAATPIQEGLQRYQMFFERLDDLLPGTTYCYVGRAENSVCLDEGNVREFTTLLSLLSVLYVDDDASSDPAPYDMNSSDLLEDGTAEHPFDMIQEAIDIAAEGVCVIVRPGSYYETIDFLGKQIELTGIDPNDPNALGFPVIDGAGAGPVVRFVRGEDPNCALNGFVITGGQGDLAGGIYSQESSPRISNCVIVGNRAQDPSGAAVYCVDSNAVFMNCTLAHNVGGEQGAGIRLTNSDVILMNSIVWGNTPYGLLLSGTSKPAISYTDMADMSGQGNIDVDPLFVQTGQWVDPDDPNATAESSDGDSIWILGDYHLVSQAGRWDTLLRIWLQDEVTSPCIDLGHPLSPVGNEPFPNGRVVNLGAHGSTVEASKSY
jgi:hypothetical protein